MGLGVRLGLVEQTIGHCHQRCDGARLDHRSTQRADPRHAPERAREHVRRGLRGVGEQEEEGRDEAPQQCELGRRSVEGGEPLGGGGIDHAVPVAVVALSTKIPTKLLLLLLEARESRLSLVNSDWSMTAT